MAAAKEAELLAMGRYEGARFRIELVRTQNASKRTEAKHLWETSGGKRFKTQEEAQAEETAEQKDAEILKFIQSTGRSGRAASAARNFVRQWEKWKVAHGVR